LILILYFFIIAKHLKVFFVTGYCSNTFKKLFIKTADSAQQT
jgi:hypothetical protein